MSNLPYRPLPVDIEAITSDWLTTALRGHAPEIDIKSVEIVDVMRSTCTKLRLKLAIENNCAASPVPQTVILKGGFEPHSRQFHYIHRKEVLSYSELLPELGLHCPKTFFTDYDPERQQGILIMEDLVQRGVTFCSALQPQGFAQIARRLTDLAKFHAASWNSPHLEPGGKWEWVDDLPVTNDHHFGLFLTPETWQKFMDLPQGSAVSREFHDLAWIKGAMKRFSVYAARLPYSVIHGDTHLGNLYVEKDGTPGFFDALECCAPPMLEVTYHMICAMDVADRACWEGALIQHYLEALCRAGVEAPSFDEAMHQYAIFMVYGYCVFIINETFFQSGAVNTAYTSRFSAAMLAHQTKQKLAAL